MEGGSNFSLVAQYLAKTALAAGAVLPLGYMTSSEMPHQPSQTLANNETDEKYKAFKQFDTVVDHSDHFYAQPGNGKVQAANKVPH